MHEAAAKLAPELTADPGDLMREAIAELRRTQAAVLIAAENGSTTPLMESLAVLREFGNDMRGLAYAIAIGERLADTGGSSRPRVPAQRGSQHPLMTLVPGFEP